MAKKKDNAPEKATLADDLLIREVDEELRAEKLQDWWKRFGSLLVGGCVTVVLATIAYQAITSYQTSVAEEDTTILLNAQAFEDKSQIETALKKLAPLTEKESHAGDIAKLRRAYLTNRQSENIADFDSLATDAKSEVVADIAKLQAGQASKIAAESPFYPLAAEQQSIALLAEDKKDEAKQLILSLLDRSDIPSNQRKRLGELLQETQ